MTHFIQGGGSASSVPNSPISSLFCLKTLCAFFVVCIHFSNYVFYLNPLIRIAVPAFFIISGYFLYSPNRQQAIARCKRWLRKIVLFTLGANLFYLSVQTALLLAGGNSTLPEADLKSLLRLLFIGDNIGVHLWYLTACIEVLLFFLAILKLKLEKILWLAIPLGLFLCLLLGRYGFLLPQYHAGYFLFSRSFLTVGLPFFGIGYLIRKYQPQIMQGKIQTMGHPLICSLFLLLSIAETGILSLLTRHSAGDLIFFTIPTVVSVFLFCLRQPNLGRGKTIETIGRKYATDIYIFHQFVGLTLSIFLHRIEGLFEVPIAFFPVLVFLFSLLFAILIRQFLQYLRLTPSPAE